MQFRSRLDLLWHKMPQAALLAVLMLALLPELASAQDLQRHGEVTAVDGQEITIQLNEGLSVSVGTVGTIYTTTTVGGEERSVRVAQVEVTRAEGRTVTAQVTNQTEAPETGFLTSFESVQRLGTLMVETGPSEAAIRVDGNAAGTGTARERVKAGSHAVVANAEGYESARRELIIEAGQTREIAFDLQQLTGRLVVETTPDSARIHFNGRFSERGLAEQSLVPGEHKIGVQAEGYAPVDTVATVVEGQQRRLSLTLGKEPSKDEAAATYDIEGLDRDPQRAPLPRYAEEVNARIQVQITVNPEGRIVCRIPLKKGSPKLEAAVMDALQKWRFNALPPGASQENQIGTVTFTFRLN